ncbi:MAG: hypothetical protein K2W85_14370 [Phycisphaerales bacterium]|nr:hypothetical protein [Phycisphaerales bacterium]
MATRQTLGGDPAPKSSSKPKAGGGDPADAAARKKRVVVMTVLFVVLLGAVIRYYWPTKETLEEAGQVNPEPVVDESDPANVPPPPPPEPELGPNDFTEIPRPVPG